MLQGPPASRPLSSQQNDDRYKTLPSLESRTLPPLNENTNAGSSILGECRAPSARAIPAESPSSQKSSRSFGMQSILNPAGKDSSESQSRRRKADQAGLPSPATSMTPSPGTVSLPSITPPSLDIHLPSMNQGSRLTLTPRSATGYLPNTISNAIPGTIDAKTTPFIGSSGPVNANVLESSNRTEYPLSHPQPQHPQGSGYAGTFLPARSPPGRRPSGGSQLPTSVDRRASVTGSDSPSTTYSSYSQFSRTPPAVQNNPISQPSSAFFGMPYPAPGHSLAHGFGNNGPVSSTTAQSPYQMMTMDTEQGPIQVPVDVQAASKVADEKRKRNATASHRFRQRRKEKERETSNNIAKLEKQIHDVEQEREFYRQERDYFRSLVCRNPSQAHLSQRPPSPRHLRPAVQSEGEEGLVTGQWQPRQHDDGNQNGRNTRRRTSSYVPAQDLPESLPNMPGPPLQQQQQQQQQQHVPHPVYAQLQPANMRADETQPRTPARGRPTSTFPPPNHAATWHPTRR